MKKSMLCVGLITVFCATAYAEDGDKSFNSGTNSVQEISTMQGPQPPANPGMPSPLDKSTQPPAPPGTGAPDHEQGIQTPHSPHAPIPEHEGTQPPATPGEQVPSTPGIQTPANPTKKEPLASSAANPAKAIVAAAASVPANKTATTPAQGAPAQSTATPSIATPASSTQATPAEASKPTPIIAAAAPAQPMNCNYHIPADITRIDQTVVLKWSEKAAEQSFDFDHKILDKQLADLKACYTEQGWEGFNDALQKSGNLEAIKSQQLTVSSMVAGNGNVVEIKENQWKVTLPVQVVYQNDKEKLTQPLTVNLVVGRKVSGDLGILQMIAVPRQPVNSSAPMANPANTPTTKSTSGSTAPAAGETPAAATTQPATNADKKPANP